MSYRVCIPAGKPSEEYRLDCLNWPEGWPYKPAVSFRIWHSGDAIHLEYTVDEQSVRALSHVRGDFVYEDSCVEFFFQPRPEDPHYYNFEFNAIGNLNLSWRTGRDDPESAPAWVLEAVKSSSSLGAEPFAERPADGPWKLEVLIPAKALWHSAVESFEGLQAKGNFYKCGDALKVPHFVTFAPIATPKPDYHRPEFFIPLEFE